MYICTCIHIHICVYTYISSHICIYILKYPSEPGPITLHNPISLSPLHTHIYILRPSSKPSSLSLALNLSSLSLSHTPLAQGWPLTGFAEASAIALAYLVFVIVGSAGVFPKFQFVQFLTHKCQLHCPLQSLNIVNWVCFRLGAFQCSPFVEVLRCQLHRHLQSFDIVNWVCFNLDVFLYFFFFQKSERSVLPAYLVVVFVGSTGAYAVSRKFVRDSIYCVEWL